MRGGVDPARQPRDDRHARLAPARARAGARSGMPRPRRCARRPSRRRCASASADVAAHDQRGRRALELGEQAADSRHRRGTDSARRASRPRAISRRDRAGIGDLRRPRRRRARRASGSASSAASRAAEARDQLAIGDRADHRPSGSAAAARRPRASAHSSCRRPAARCPRSSRSILARCFHSTISASASSSRTRSNRPKQAALTGALIAAAIPATATRCGASASSAEPHRRHRPGPTASAARARCPSASRRPCRRLKLAARPDSNGRGTPPAPASTRRARQQPPRRSAPPPRPWPDRAAASPPPAPCGRCAARWSRRYCPIRSLRRSPAPASARQQHPERDRAQQIAEQQRQPRAPSRGFRSATRIPLYVRPKHRRCRQARAT